LKEPDKMSRMKDDMSGAAAVLSAIDVIASRKLPLDVMAIVAAAENMPGPSASDRATSWSAPTARPSRSSTPTPRVALSWPTR